MASKNSKATDESVKYFCNDCGKSLGERKFYSTDNPKYKASNGKLPFCKDCIKESYFKSFGLTKNTKESIIATAMRFDIPFIENNIPAFEDNENMSKEDSLIVWYEFIKISNSVGKKLLYKTGFDYENWVSKVLTAEGAKVLDEDEKLYLSESDFGIEISSEEIMFFGEGYTRKQYVFLTKGFLALAQSYDIPNSTVAEIYKDLCFLNLRIDEAKHNGTPEKEILAMIEGRRKLLKDANISLYEKKGDEKIEGIGKMVKRMELTRPAVQSLPEWEENNTLEELSNIIAGHILMADGYDNQVVQDYKKTVEPHSIDVENLWGDDGEEI